MFNPSRAQARSLFLDAWRKHVQRLPLSAMEDRALRIELHHPEYRALLEDPAAMTKEFDPDAGEGNPFLHLSLHLAIEEQLAIDQPAGIRAAFDALVARHGDRHDALHDVLECLAETVWRSQRAGTPPDGAAYLECVRRARG